MFAEYSSSLIGYSGLGFWRTLLYTILGLFFCGVYCDKIRSRTFHLCFYEILYCNFCMSRKQEPFLLIIDKLFVYQGYFCATLWCGGLRLLGVFFDTIKLDTIRGNVCCLFVTVRIVCRILCKRFQFLASRFSSSTRLMTSAIEMPRRLASDLSHVSCGLVRTTDRWMIAMWTRYTLVYAGVK